MATFQEGTFVNQRSQELYYRTWKTPVKARAALVFHHGYGSHSGAYDNEFRKMAEAGIRLFMYDAHSFGRSEPKDPGHRSLVWKWEDLVDDIYYFRKEIVDPQLQAEPLPLFLAGLSMGGFATILAGIRDQSAWKGLIVLSPAVDCARDFMLTIMVALQSVLCKICPRARIVPQPLIPKVTLNEQERKLLAEDPFFDPKKVRIQTGSMFLKGWDVITKREQELTLPILIHYSTIDEVVYPPATERFARNVQSKDVTIKPFDKFAHDIYLDTSKDESCALLIEWILNHAEANTTAAPTTAADEQAKL